ncbi:MAG: serine protein kinase PrkA, partial [Myxococcales bacterium]
MPESKPAPGRPSGEPRSVLSTIGDEVKAAFIENRTILSFEEYLDVFVQNPRRQARNAAQYVRDVFDYFGHETEKTPGGPMRRFKLFDQTFEGEPSVAGHEEVQNSIYRVLNNFVRLGRVNKLILLHGPNGSAKSSLINAIMRGMEHYSRQPEGALYRFNWIFPSHKLVKGSVGFGGGERGSGAPQTQSFAHLEGDAIDARIVCEMKDHPLFLIPRKQRRPLLEKHCNATSGAEAPGDADFILADYLVGGELCHKCRLIYSALLSHYAGDYAQVLRHIQVERFYVSRRYQAGSVTVEPQMSVDASFRQV